MDEALRKYFAERKEMARQWNEKMEKEYADSIHYSVNHAKIYPDCMAYGNMFGGGSVAGGSWIRELSKGHFPQKQHISVMDKDTASAVMDADGKVAVLNFASYWYPGGGFTEGYNAQEETLCFESTLYQVLSRCGDYYGHRIVGVDGEEINWDDAGIETGKYFYFSDILYTPDIVFIKNGAEKKADVITCAAPNICAYMAGMVSDGMFFPVLFHEQVVEPWIKTIIRSRIRHILAAAYANGAEALVLGAWGCGAFGNDPNLVAEEFKRGIRRSRVYSTVRDYVFAIPYAEGQRASNQLGPMADKCNYEVFRDAFR